MAKQFPVLENDHGIRPAGPDDACFYCGQTVGENHKDDCVTIVKKVEVKATLTYNIQVPNFWTADDIEQHRNNGSWCASNIINELEYVEGSGCLCGRLHTEVSRMDVTGPYITLREDNENH